MARTRLSTKPDVRRGEATRSRIIAATAEVIRTRGFVGATTSTIAEQAEVNQGVIFYHFGSLTQLFGETLDATSANRLEGYRIGLEGVEGLDRLFERAARLFAEDRERGYVKVLTELVAGAAAIEELRPMLRDHVERWVAFVEEVFETRLDTGGILGLLPPPRQIALLVVSVYLGAELLIDLAPEFGAGEALADFADRLAVLAKLVATGSWK